MRVAGREHGLDVERVTALAQQRHLAHRRALDARGHGVHAEGRWADDDVVDARAAEAAHHQIDGLVTAAARQQLRDIDAVKCGQPRRQLVRMRLGIAIEARQGAIGFRAPRQFVGMQPIEGRIPAGV